MADELQRRALCKELGIDYDPAQAAAIDRVIVLRECELGFRSLTVKFEPPDVVPTIILSEAWEVAFNIDNEVAELMSEYGLNRIEGRSRVIEAIARMVQLAINRSVCRLEAHQ